MTMRESSNCTYNSSKTNTWNNGSRTMPNLFPTITRPNPDFNTLLKKLFLFLHHLFLLCKSPNMTHLRYQPRIILFLGLLYPHLTGSSSPYQINFIVKTRNLECKRYRHRYLHSLQLLPTVDHTQMQALCL